jgi:hypothetical protein
MSSLHLAASGRQTILHSPALHWASSSAFSGGGQALPQAPQ